MCKCCEIITTVSLVKTTSTQAPKLIYFYCMEFPHKAVGTWEISRNFIIYLTNAGYIHVCIIFLSLIKFWAPLNKGHVFYFLYFSFPTSIGARISHFHTFKIGVQNVSYNFHLKYTALFANCFTHASFTLPAGF